MKTERNDGYFILSYVFGVVLLIQSLRIWLPSLITIYGDAGSSSPVAMGVFAISLFLSAFIMIPLYKWIQVKWLARIISIGLAVSLILLQLSNGGNFQWYASTAALAFGLYWLVFQAMISHNQNVSTLGIAAGMVLSVILHQSLNTVDLVWRTGFIPWIIQLTMIGIFLICTFSVCFKEKADLESQGSARLWMMVGPILFIVGVVSGSGSRAETVTSSWPYPVATILLLFVLVGSLLFIKRGGLVKGRPLVATLLLFISIVVAIIPVGEHNNFVRILPEWTFLFQLLSIITMMAVIGHARMDLKVASPGKRGAFAALGMFLFVLFMFVYYGTYDLIVDFPNQYILLIAVLVIIVSLWKVKEREAKEPLALFKPVFRAMLLALLVGSGTMALQASPQPASTTIDYPVRVMTYNIRMGYSADGTFNPHTLAKVIMKEQPDIVVLNEVDRGWLLNGEHDILRLLSTFTNMSYTWAPTADPVWGLAILSNVPIKEKSSRLLPQTAPIYKWNVHCQRHRQHTLSKKSIIFICQMNYMQRISMYRKA